MIFPRRFVRSAAAAVLTLTLATGVASAAYGVGTVTDGPLRLREEASTSSTVLASAAEGSTVTILEEATDGWYKVEYGGKTGYMSADYLAVAIGDEAVPLAASAEDETLYARVDTEVLNVREGPGTDYERIGKLYSGSIVTVLSQTEDWAEVELDDVKGFVSSEYLVFGTKDELTAASALGDRIVEIAKQYLGTPYAYGGASPSGFDCSGFVSYVAKCVGYTLPHSATAIWNQGYTRVSRSELQPGDLVFFSKTSGGKYIGHIGIYVGNGTIIHSSSPSAGGVIYSSLSANYYNSRYYGACRIG